MSDTRAPFWKRLLAGILDFFTVFMIGGLIIAQFTGDTTEGGFSLEGWPATILFLTLAAYFYLMPFYGGTIWQRIFKIEPRLPGSR